jgi:O-antigen/teichoic acid export membrane protein
MKGFLNDLFSVGISKILVIVFGLCYNIIIARFLGPELNGTIATLLVYPTLFMTIGSLGIRQSTAYFVGKGVFDEESIKRAVVQLWYLSSILSIFSSFLLIKYFSNSGESFWLVCLAIFPIPFALFNTYNSGLHLGKNEIKKFNQVNWLPPFFKLVAAIIFIIGLSYSIYGALAAAAIAPLVMSIIMLVRNNFISGFSLVFDFKVFKSLLSLGLTYAFALLIINLNYKIDVIFLDKLSSSYETGIYSKGVSLIEYLWQIPMLLSTIVFARSASSKNNDDFSLKVIQLLRVSFIFVGILSVVLAVCSEIIIELLYGASFRPSSTVLVYLLPGVVLLTIFKVLNMDMAGRGKPWISLYAMFPALIVNVALNFFLIPSMGASGAAIASTISYSVSAILFIMIYANTVGISIKQIVSFKTSDFNFMGKILGKLKLSA